jgi:spore coat protein A
LYLKLLQQLIQHMTFQSERRFFMKASFTNRKGFSLFFGCVLALLALCAWSIPGALAQQVPLNPSKIPQFVDPLPLLSVQTGGTIDTIVDGGGGNSYTLTMTEFNARVLPTGTFVAGQAPLTKVWGYRRTPPAGTGENTYIGPVFVGKRSQFPVGGPNVDNSIEVTYLNNLGVVDPNPAVGSQLLFYRTATDQTLHWADPNGLMCSEIGGVPAPGSPCAGNYFGPIPAVAHLHGGEVPPVVDGGPDAWFLSQTQSGYTAHGHAFYSKDDPTNIGTANYAIYDYPNTQEAAPIWFHDHTLGATRLNVYAGLAGAYIIYDDANPPAAGLGGLAGAATIVPLVIQDRMFDTTGQLFFPSIGINPEHPFWVPEFVGNVIAVNGKVWPFLEVTPARYRFLLLNGSNARAYTLNFKVQGKGTSPTIWVISTDGGYLDNPVPVQQLTIMPGERYGVIVDFSGFKAGTTLTLQNSARTPFPGGAPAQGSTTGKVMQFRVVTTPTTGLPVAPTTTFVPTATTNLRPTNPIQRLVTAGAPATGVTVNKTRLLTLNEVIGAGGPLEILVNNTKWSGKLGNNVRTDFTAVTVGGVTEYYSELPQEGETELWEIVNTTADAHPIHLHLVQFQLMNRQAFNLKAYTPVYDAAFQSGLYIPGSGPPLDYNTGNPNALGGNPDVTPYLLGAAAPPLPQEQGWKDTVIMYPGEVTRIMVRWTPTDVPVGTSSTSAAAAYPFDPKASDHGYVWHCHIVDHEDNEMMRPTQVQVNAVATRTFVLGTDY